MMKKHQIGECDKQMVEEKKKEHLEWNTKGFPPSLKRRPAAFKGAQTDGKTGDLQVGCAVEKAKGAMFQSAHAHSPAS
eukprot:7088532-Pyramimonas_sp.AAC.1